MRNGWLGLIVASLIVLVAALLSYPSRAANELQGQSLSEVNKMAQKHGVIVEKLNDADAAAMDSKTDPRPKPSVIYLLTIGSGVLIVLVRDEIVIFSSNPVELETINKMLDRSGT
jgi:hypothetical protein